MTDVPAQGVPARPAGTVLLLRDRADGGIEVHMQRRRAEMDFGGLAFVFPGGSMDAADADETTLALLRGVDLQGPAARMHLAGEDGLTLCAGLHVCAVREVFEEAGLLLAVDASGAGATAGEGLDELRRRVLAGAALGAELAPLGLRPAIEDLVYVAHFVTPLGMPRRYDTRFFATRAPAGVEPVFHGGEATSGDWFEPGAMLAEADRGGALLMPPTRILLAELRRHGDVATALETLGSRPVASILFDLRLLHLPLPDHLPTVEEMAASDAAPE